MLRNNSIVMKTLGTVDFYWNYNVYKYINRKQTEKNTLVGEGLININNYWK